MSTLYGAKNEVNEPGLPFEIQNFLPLSPVTKCFFFLTQRNDERGLSSWAHKFPRYLQGGGRMNWGMNGRCCHNNIMDLVVVIIILDYCRIAGRQYYLLWTGLEKNKHYFIQELVVECQFAEQRLRNVGILTRATTRYQGATTIIILGIQLVAKKSWPFLACFRGASGWWFLSFVSTLEGYSPVQLLLIIVFVCFYLFLRILCYFYNRKMWGTPDKNIFLGCSKLLFV